jgi:hypothetical protein
MDWPSAVTMFVRILNLAASTYDSVHNTLQSRVSDALYAHTRRTNLSDPGEIFCFLRMLFYRKPYRFVLVPPHSPTKIAINLLADHAIIRFESQSYCESHFSIHTRRTHTFGPKQFAFQQLTRPSAAWWSIEALSQAVIIWCHVASTI